MRSLSLTRSSAAPVTRERPRGVGGGHGQGGHLVDERGHHRRGDARSRAARDERASIQPDRLRLRRCRRRSRSSAPIARSTSRNAVRAGFSSTPSMRTSESGRMSAATTRKAALETSPGHVTVVARSGGRRRTDDRAASALDGDAEDRQQALGVVAARAPARVTVVSPSACSPASSTAVFTCALATGRSPAHAAQRAALDGQRAAGRRWSRRARPWPAAAPPRAPSAGGAARRRRSRTERNGRPARTPASMRRVDPELPASSDRARRAPGLGPPAGDDDRAPSRGGRRRRARPGSAAWTRSRRRLEKSRSGSRRGPSRPGWPAGGRSTCRPAG